MTKIQQERAYCATLGQKRLAKLKSEHKSLFISVIITPIYAVFNFPELVKCEDTPNSFNHAKRPSPCKKSIG
ncbi:MAG: hypothetical protein AMDU5_GPLC00015G0009 [Thermoplasmatales archaeon Gpl]|nr:MAG: hypothetical protein AMDU5_GPLC00015G0009 [Thermoplasmatales archaeon Gpl]